MPPKIKEPVTKKATPFVVRQAISSSSLLYVPDDVIEGFQERIETGIDWTLISSAVRGHKALCKREPIPKVTFSEAVEKKITKSIINGFLDEESRMTLEEHWEFLLPITLWDNEKFANKEEKICFINDNCITDDLVKLIRMTMKTGDRKRLKDAMKLVTVLRVNDVEMSELDESLLEYKKLISLNLCGNFLAELNPALIPSSVRNLELQTNRFSDISGFAESLPVELLYLGLAKNFITSDNVDAIGLLPFNLTVLDLSDNDIYHLDDVLDAVSRLPNLNGLQLSGNPCSVCAGYARATLSKLTRLRWLDCREILESDRPATPMDVHSDDLRSANFFFTVFRIMSVPQPPKTEKGVFTSFHVELEIPLLDVVRRRFLMFRRNESLIEMLPPPEDDDWHTMPSVPVMSKINPSIEEEASSHASDIYTKLEARNPREIRNFTTFETNKVQWNKMMNFQEPALKIFCPDLTALRDTFRSIITLRLIYSIVSLFRNFTTFETNKVQWNKMMNFQEPALKIFCPDLTALRDTFRSIITLRLIYSMTHAPQKSGKQKSMAAMPIPGDLRVTVATIKCALNCPDWSQPGQHFHWDETLGTNDAIHWGDGDLAILQYSQVEKTTKTPKGKMDDAGTSSRQVIPDELTCHFGFGIETLKQH